LTLSDEKLKNFLNLLWLRPENALLGVFKSDAYSHIPFESPSLDISCGDGLFTFLHLGGELDPDFDYFQSTKSNNFTHSNFVDIYNHIDDNYSVPILKKPIIKIDYGIDWKQSLIDKASKLDLYKNLLVHDNNQLPLPFDNNSFRTIYSNSVYWVNDSAALIDDIYRIVQPGGEVILELATPYFYETLDDLQNILSEEAITILDRKRRETSPGLKTFSEWKEIMENSNFTIAEIKSVYPNKLLLDIWNIGLRPISHLLIQMSDNLTLEKRGAIKKEWVEIFFTLFRSLLKLEQTYSMEKAPYIMFRLKK